MFSNKRISKTLMAFAGISCLASTPAAAQCVIGKEEMLDPFVYNQGTSTIVHKDSGFIFPAEVAGFQRECAMTKDFTGNNFQIGYVKAIGEDNIDVRITVIHLVGLKARDHYEIIKPDVMAHFSSAAPLSEGEYYVPGRPELNAYQGIFESEYNGIPWHFSTTTIDYGHWDARLTVTYPVKIDKIAQEDLMELITAFQWQTPEGLTHEEPVQDDPLK